jgi:hypothetical protein
LHPMIRCSSSPSLLSLYSVGAAAVTSISHPRGPLIPFPHPPRHPPRPHRLQHLLLPLPRHLLFVLLVTDPIAPAINRFPRG